jgi:hypothetical protein
MKPITLTVEVGQRIDRLVVIDPDIRVPGNARGARLRCDCGKVCEIRIANLLRNGRVKPASCGCLTGRPRALAVSAGQRIGRGVVIDPDIRTGFTRSHPGGRPGAKLRCDCGTVYEAALMSLMERDGHINTQSCGCLHEEQAPLNGQLGSTTHGLHSHQLYGTWRQMLQRCENPDVDSYRYYGAKGRSVCDRWHDITAFIADIERDLGPRPEGMTLDRMNNQGNYEPGNVRWATAAEQVANRG